MKKHSMIIHGVLLLSVFLTIALVRQTFATAPHPIKHSTPKVELSIKFGRIFFEPNTVTCSHTAKPCFILEYASNDGPRPVWLNGNAEYILQPHQSWPFTFTTPGTELFTLFKTSPWWKLKVIVV